MTTLIDAIAQLFIAMNNTYVTFPGGGSVRMSVLCFGLPVLVAAVGLLVPWGDVGGEEDD